MMGAADGNPNLAHFGRDSDFGEPVGIRCKPGLDFHPQSIIQAVRLVHRSLARAWRVIVWTLFGPSKIFLVFGAYKQAGYITLAEKFLECFSNQRVASVFAAKVREEGFEGRRFQYVEVREVEPKNGY